MPPLLGYYPGQFANSVSGTNLFGSPFIFILPFIEQQNLYQSFKRDEPWDSENNKKLLESMPKIYAPVRGMAEKNKTFYQAF